MPIARVKPRLHLPALNRQDQRARGLAGYWPMWEGAGSRVMEVAGGNHGVLTGATWAGATVVLGGENSGDSMGFQLFAFASAEPMTWTWRARLDTLHNGDSIFASTVDSSGLILLSTCAVRMSISYGSVANSGAGYVLNDGQFHVYTLTRDSANLVKFWRDGQLHSSVSRSGAWNIDTMGIDVVGGDAWGGPFSVLGVHKRVLPLSEIQDLYNDPYLPITPRKMFPVAVAVAAGGHPTMRRWGGVPYMTPGYQTLGRSW